MGGILGGSQTTKTEIPAWLEEPAIRAIQRGEDISQIGYTPYSGPDVAAFSPAQEASFLNNSLGAAAFGLAAPTSTGMPAAQDFGGGVRGYSSMPTYQGSLDWLQQTRPGQYGAMTGMFIDPFTGAPSQQSQQAAASDPYMDMYAASMADRTGMSTPSHAELTAQYGWGDPVGGLLSDVGGMFTNSWGVF